MLIATTLLACDRKEPPGAATAPSAGLALATSGSAEPPQRVQATPSASPSASAGPIEVASTSPTLSAAPAASSSAPIDWKNEAQPPHTSAELEASGRALLEAIVQDDVERAHYFFFPREPFTPLKDSSDPDRYWKHLYRAYEQDIHKLHRRRRDWSGVTFESIEPGTPPVWVPPGDESNKIGYYRSWGTKLRYRVDGQRYTVKIHTIISWQGGWHITHLLPWKKK